MKDLLKNQKNNVILSICYIIVATVVYTSGAQCLWQNIPVTITVCVVVLIIGLVIAYLFVKSEEKARIQKEEALKEIPTQEQNS